MDYNFSVLEKKWQDYWEQKKVFRTSKHTDASAKKFYTLSMFPYPSGEGLHVGHPVGYIAGDIYARYKKLLGFHVLHPMGFDAFGLPAEQYAIKQGKHPKVSTRENIERYTQQLKKMGFSFDWDRVFSTSDPDYYQWTQWIFLKLFGSYYCNKLKKAQPISKLEQIFETEGNANCYAFSDEDAVKIFSKEVWKNFSAQKREEVLQQYRLAYLGKGFVNWSPSMKTVLANDEVKDGYSIHDGNPVEQKETQQWNLRITAYADRLLEGLKTIAWSDEMKHIQSEWIGRSEGANVYFELKNHPHRLTTFTTRPDTLFGVSYLTLAPEHPLVKEITTSAQREEIMDYVKRAKHLSERDRLAQADQVSGAFTGAYALHPFSGECIPIWISDYVLMSYGTGAVMAVPAHDERDHRFAKKFQLPLKEVIWGGDNINKEAYTKKEGTLVGSDFLNGLSVKDAIAACIKELVLQNKGRAKVSYRIRNAVFSRQRYWGEPIPIYYDEQHIPRPVKEEELPLRLPDIEKFAPDNEGSPPLARAKDWKYQNKYPYEYTTMPAWAGSSWYYLRYMDPANKSEICAKQSSQYWGQVDLYVGGKEHATGHLIYARFWNKFLKDLNVVDQEEPFARLINQGMINHQAGIIHRIPDTDEYISYEKSRELDEKTIPIFIHSKLFDSKTHIVDLDALKQWQPEFQEGGIFKTDADGLFRCQVSMYKMSKSKFNVVNPDEIIDRYGADALRMYEMFMGPISDSKPWSETGITGVFGFLVKFWKLFHRENRFQISEGKSSPENLKSLHKAIKQITRDIEKFSFNTCVSSFMICVNELSVQRCNLREILEPLTILLSPFAPHISEEVWQKMGYKTSIFKANFPIHNEEYLEEKHTKYAVMFNGKRKFEHTLEKSLSKSEVEDRVLSLEETQKYLHNRSIKKIVVVPHRVVNIVV